MTTLKANMYHNEEKDIEQTEVIKEIGKLSLKQQASIECKQYNLACFFRGAILALAWIRDNKHKVSENEESLFVEQIMKDKLLELECAVDEDIKVRNNERELDEQYSEEYPYAL